MGIPVVDFSKIDGKDRADTLVLIDQYCKEWGFFQLINHGISEELLDRVKTVATECYKLEREASFKNSKPVQLLNELLGKNSDEKIENVDWEDVFLLSDENGAEWPSKTPGFIETMKEYRTELKKLGHKVMEIMDENLGLPKGYIKNAFDGGVDNTAFFGTKVSHYPPCPHPEKVINTGDQIEVLSNGGTRVFYTELYPKQMGKRDQLLHFTIHHSRQPLHRSTIALSQSGE
ncbi:UNVERIFIED_CONTAM: 1-aminocyclopropane-1-carboxylate oxidase 5 [Sesamum calycinum]|uniref:1-aminocyclopropane-1-carboxylate oxidase 5 n=1 Tax=Sesamum calycinum TaxID=2727403 RepID=A0AAW2N453_9LAMI